MKTAYSLYQNQFKCYKLQTNCLSKLVFVFLMPQEKTNEQNLKLHTSTS